VFNQVAADFQVVAEDGSVKGGLILAVLVDVRTALQNKPDDVTVAAVNCQDQRRVALRHAHRHEVFGRERFDDPLDGIQIAMLDEVFKHANFVADWQEKDALEAVLADIVVY